ncbi:MAG: reverse transcriptase domain-containing protein [Chloroflexales bacterium]
MPIFPRYDGPSLIDQVCGVENLTLAWRRVRSNIQVARRRSSAGVDAVTLRDFEADWPTQMTCLADELRGGSYRPLPARQVQIPKASGGTRAIAILAVRDRVAQRAVQQVLQPLFEPLLLDCSYGSRLAVGVPDAVARVARYAEQGLTWALDADIAAYFDSIDQRILLGLLRQRIDEPAILQLIVRWLQAGALQAGEDAPLAPEERVVGSALLARGQAALRGLLGAGDSLPARPPAALGLDPLSDPYAAASWESAPLAAQPSAYPGMANGLWTAIGLAKPALEGARRALPHLRRIGAQRMLIAGAVAAGAVAASELMLRASDGLGQGTPQGGALSPLLANIYLHPFDLALTSQGLRLVRYVDDFVVMCASQAEATRALQLVRDQIATLRLQLNAEKTRIVAYADGLEFLGQALAPRQTGPRLGAGLGSFEDAEQALRAAARKVRSSADQVGQRFQRPNQKKGD